MIQISNLQKKFGEKTAVNIDNYLINQGETDARCGQHLQLRAENPRFGHHDVQRARHAGNTRMGAVGIYAGRCD